MKTPDFKSLAKKKASGWWTRLRKRVLIYPNETIGGEILKVIHRHPLYFWKRILFVIAAVLILLAMFIFGIFQGFGFVVVTGLMLIGGFIVGASLNIFLLWKQDVFIITGSEIVDVTKPALFERKEVTGSIKNIAQVLHSQKGVDVLLGVGGVKLVFTAFEGEHMFIYPVKEFLLIDEFINQLKKSLDQKEFEDSIKQEFQKERELAQLKAQFEQEEEERKPLYLRG